MECVWDIKIKSCQRRKTGFMSEHKLSYFSRWIWNLNPSNAILAVCGTLCCWRVNQLTVHVSESSDMFSSVRPVFSSTFLILSSFTFPAEEKHSYTIMLPLPWFTMRKVCSVNFLLHIIVYMSMLFPSSNNGWLDV